MGLYQFLSRYRTDVTDVIVMLFEKSIELINRFARA